MKQSYNFNCPPLPVKMDSSKSCGPWFKVDSESVILETLKVCETAQDQTVEPNRKVLVARFYESCGNREKAK